MPELPEVEVLVRHLRPLIRNRTVRAVDVWRKKVLAPTTEDELRAALVGATFAGASRRGKYIVFQLNRKRTTRPVILVGHLGMTGRFFLARRRTPLPKHTAVAIRLGSEDLIYQDTRYFGRMTLDASAIRRLGPEPLSSDFKQQPFAEALKRSVQPIKVKLLDQALVAGIGNIYASEILFVAGISPRVPSRRLKPAQSEGLWCAIRQVLREAIDYGGTVPLDFSGDGERDGLFYYGRTAGSGDSYEERLRVYDRAGEPCLKCGAPIQRIVQAARSSYYCVVCQP